MNHSMDHFNKWSETLPIYQTTPQRSWRGIFMLMNFQVSNACAAVDRSMQRARNRSLPGIVAAHGHRKTEATAHKPSTNGLVERYRRSLNSILCKIAADDQRDWCERAPIAAAASRASVHKATHYSPNREVRAPIDIIFGCPPGEDDRYTSDDAFVDEQQQRMREVYGKVR